MIVWQPSQAFIKVIASILSDLAAAAIGAAFISWNLPFFLIKYSLSGTVFIVIATALERLLEPPPSL